MLCSKQLIRGLFEARISSLALRLLWLVLARMHQKLLSTLLHYCELGHSLLSSGVAIYRLVILRIGQLGSTIARDKLSAE